MGSAASMRRAAEIIERQNANITVLSAMSGTTDALAGISALAAGKEKGAEVAAALGTLREKYVACVKELLSARREEAMQKIDETFSLVAVEAAGYRGVLSERLILAQGELLTSAIFAMYMSERGNPAALLHAPDFMHKNGEARADTAFLKKSLSGLDGHTYYITQGFICRDVNGDMDNLGRGGSDYSAALIGAALDASQVQIWTDIDGMRNNDPRVVERTVPIRRMHFDEAAELAYFGAKILHPSTIQPCKEKGIPVLLKDTMDPGAEGTVISNGEDTGRVYRAVAAKDGITVVRIHSARMLMAYGFLKKVFEVFEKYETPIDMITTSEVAVSLTIDNDANLGQIVEELRPLGSIETESGNTIACVVGLLNHAESGRALEIMEAVGDVPLKMISYGASRRSIAMLIESRYKERLLRNLNDGLFFKPDE